MKNDKVLLGHGSGGKLAAELIRNYFIGHFGNPEVFLTDSAVLKFGDAELAFTTDSYVVDPIFFPGGNIGKLAVCGTVNDLAVSGAEPLYLTSGFILEEGFPLLQLEEIVECMAKEAASAGVKIVAGDTKVVPYGKCDKIFINTSGVGLMPKKNRHISFGEKCKPGDKIIINGNIGDHGTAIMASRSQVQFNPPVLSDCSALNGLIDTILKNSDGVRFMRDATRGGLATVLCELASNRSFGISLNENEIPVSEQVNGFCEIYGFDPLYLANEGKVVIVASAEESDKILNIMKAHPLGQNSAIIGELGSEHAKQVTMKTSVGGNRMLDLLAGEQLPRIC
jgi:hydrogenase expression/formation protein HypE